MAVTFDVAQPFNFSNYQYWIVFNTSGNGLTPNTQPYNNNWAAYSEGIEITGNGGATSARAFQFVRNTQNPHITPSFQPLPTTPQQFQYNPNSNGTGTEFSVIFQRSVFIGVQPSPLPLATPWLFNAFTTQANVQGNLVFVDSMGGATGGSAFLRFSRPQHVALLRYEPDLRDFERHTSRSAGANRERRDRQQPEPHSQGDTDCGSVLER